MSLLNLPPKTCIPSSENITINKKSRSNKDAIDCIEFNNDATKFESERQYLKFDRYIIYYRLKIIYTITL